MAVDFDTPEGQVRLLVADLDEASFLVDDGMIRGYLKLHRNSVHRAAAAVLDAMATSEVLLAKVIRTQDLTTDGAKVAAELRAQANGLRARADEEDALNGEDDSFLGFIPFVPVGPLEGEERRW